MKIAMIAMSGVRAFSEELNRIGMTLPGFVERQQVIASLPRLGVLTLARLMPPHIQVEYHEVADLAKLEALSECDVAPISISSGRWALICAHAAAVLSGLGLVVVSALR